MIAVFVGGPLHGEVEQLPPDVLDAPATLRFSTLTFGKAGEATYCRQELADTPGRIAYVYEQR